MRFLNFDLWGRQPGSSPPLIASLVFTILFFVHGEIWVFLHLSRKGQDIFPASVSLMARCSAFQCFFGLSSYLTDNTVYIVSLQYASRRPHVARQVISCSRLPYLTPFTEYGLGHCLAICFHFNVFRLP